MKIMAFDVSKKYTAPGKSPVCSSRKLQVAAQLKKLTLAVMSCVGQDASGLRYGSLMIMTDQAPSSRVHMRHHTVETTGLRRLPHQGPCHQLHRALVPEPIRLSLSISSRALSLHSQVSWPPAVRRLSSRVRDTDC